MPREKRKRERTLLEAVSRSDSADNVMIIITKNPLAVKQKDRRGEYPLHKVCRDAQYDTVIMKLIDLFPDALQQRNKDGDYPLHIACSSHGHSEEVILKLIELFPAAASKCRECYNEFPLRLACENLPSSVTVIRKLVDMHPWALREADSWSWYPIHYTIAANANQSLDVAILLMEADPSVLQQTDKDGRTLLHFACWRDKIAIVEYLLQRSPINARDKSRKTALHYACLHGTDTMVQILLQRPDINANATDRFQNTALHYIMRNDSATTQDNPLALFQVLLHHPLIRIDQTNDENETPLDVVRKKVCELKSLDDNDDKKRTLPFYIEIIRLLDEEFPFRRRYRSYEYLIRQW